MRHRKWSLIAFSLVLAVSGCGTPGITPSAELASSGTPAPSPSVDAPIVHGWPGTREVPPGLYSWMPGVRGWIHNPDAESIGVSITFAPAGAAGGYKSGTPLTVAGHEGTYEQLPVRTDGVRIEVWRVDIEDTRVVIGVQAQPSSTEEELAEAHAIIESIRSELIDTPAGFRLIFTLPAGWDSG